METTQISPANKADMILSLRKEIEFQLLAKANLDSIIRKALESMPEFAQIKLIEANHQNSVAMLERLESEFANDMLSSNMSSFKVNGFNFSVKLSSGSVVIQDEEKLKTMYPQYFVSKLVPDKKKLSEALKSGKFTDSTIATIVKSPILKVDDGAKKPSTAKLIPVTEDVDF